MYYHGSYNYYKVVTIYATPAWYENSLKKKLKTIYEFVDGMIFTILGRKYED